MQTGTRRPAKEGDVRSRLFKMGARFMTGNQMVYGLKEGQGESDDQPDKEDLPPLHPAQIKVNGVMTDLNKVQLPKGPGSFYHKIFSHPLGRDRCNWNSEPAPEEPDSPSAPAPPPVPPPPPKKEAKEKGGCNACGSPRKKAEAPAPAPSPPPPTAPAPAPAPSPAPPPAAPAPAPVPPENAKPQKDLPPSFSGASQDSDEEPSTPRTKALQRWDAETEICVNFKHDKGTAFRWCAVDDYRFEPPTGFHFIMEKQHYVFADDEEEENACYRALSDPEEDPDAEWVQVGKWRIDPKGEPDILYDKGQYDEHVYVARAAGQ